MYLELQAQVLADHFFNFLGSGQPHNLVIVVVILVVRQIIILSLLPACITYMCTCACFRESSDCHFVSLCVFYTEGFFGCVDFKIVRFERNGSVI